ncbi:MAG: hypothetical protein HKO84_02870 [Pseudomonadales bacterium]|nr:hypothetical protein [Pseudomonadales bacterium]
MSQLKIRNIDFLFEDDIAFQWNPGNPGCGNMVNSTSFIAPAFERYFILAMRDAKKLIKNPALLAEAELFCRQEGQHSKQHFAHVALLIRKYPGLEETRKQVWRSYENLLASKDLKFHMAYMANLELLFAPLANYMVRNLEVLFGGSDQRIASFILWHLIEEFEHRSVAIKVYDHLFDDHRYRLKCEYAMIKHLWSDVGKIVREGLLEHVPASHNSISHVKTASIFKGTRGRLSFLMHCLDTLLPNHDPNAIEPPEWIQQWLRDDEQGVDMARYYPPQPLESPAPAISEISA